MVIILDNPVFLVSDRRYHPLRLPFSDTVLPLQANEATVCRLDDSSSISRCSVYLLRLCWPSLQTQRGVYPKRGWQIVEEGTLCGSLLPKQDIDFCLWMGSYEHHPWAISCNKWRNTTFERSKQVRECRPARQQVTTKVELKAWWSRCQRACSRGVRCSKVKWRVT